MVAMVHVSVYQNLLVTEGECLFQEDPLSILLAKCEELFLKSNHRENYPEKEVSRRVAKLVDSISLEESIVVKVTGQELNWQDLLANLERYYPQIAWISGRKSLSDNSYQFSYIPIVLNSSGFPFGFSLDKSLQQQELSSTDERTIIDAWAMDLTSMVADYIALGDGFVANYIALGEGFVEDFITYDNATTSVDPLATGKTEETENHNNYYETNFGTPSYDMTESTLPVVGGASHEQLIIDNSQLREQVKVLTAELIEAQKTINILRSGETQVKVSVSSKPSEIEMANLLQKTNQQLATLTQQLTAQEMAKLHHLSARDLVIQP